MDRGILRTEGDIGKRCQTSVRRTPPPPVFAKASAGDPVDSLLVSETPSSSKRAARGLGAP